MTKSDKSDPDIDDEEPIPKLPRAKLFGKPSGPVMMRVGMFGVMLYALIMMREPCAKGAARFVGQFSESETGDAGAAQPGASQPGQPTRYPGYQIVTAEEALEMLREAQGGIDGGLDAGQDAKAADATTPDAGE